MYAPSFSHETYQASQFHSQVPMFYKRQYVLIMFTNTSFNLRMKTEITIMVGPILCQANKRPAMPVWSQENTAT